MIEDVVSTLRSYYVNHGDERESAPLRVLAAMEDISFYEPKVRMFRAIYKFVKQMKDIYGETFNSVSLINEEILCKEMASLLRDFANEVNVVASAFETRGQTDMDWTGEGKSPEKQKKTLRCRHCKKYPFQNKEILTDRKLRILFRPEDEVEHA